MKKLMIVLIILACSNLLVPALAEQVSHNVLRYKTEPPARSFQPLEIYLDSGDQPLAAYQFELTAAVGEVAIVGVESGAHPAFSKPPYYDPAALQKGRILIADFNTVSDLPTGKTRVATVHLMISGPTKPKYELKLIVAANPDGNEIQAKISYVQGEQK